VNSGYKRLCSKWGGGVRGKVWRLGQKCLKWKTGHVFASQANETAEIWERDGWSMGRGASLCGRAGEKQAHLSLSLGETLPFP
jgi:hypothetical protein